MYPNAVLNNLFVLSYSEAVEHLLDVCKSQSLVPIYNALEPQVDCCLSLDQKEEHHSEVLELKTNSHLTWLLWMVHPKEK